MKSPTSLGGYDATRRNRDIGTRKSGHGRDNRQQIAWPDDRIFYDRLTNPVIIGGVVRGHDIPIFVEPTRSTFVHACTVDDVLEVH